jgi:hypothetical protein
MLGWAIPALRKTLSVDTLVGCNANEAAVVPMVGFGGVWSLKSCFRFCVVAFSRNLASVAVNMFSYTIYFTKKFYKISASVRFPKIILQ